MSRSPSSGGSPHRYVIAASLEGLGPPVAWAHAHKLSCAQLLRALDYLKEEFQVMHRDIKPSNVLLGHDGSIKVRRFALWARTCSYVYESARNNLRLITTPSSPLPLTTPSSATLALPT